MPGFPFPNEVSAIIFRQLWEDTSETLVPVGSENSTHRRGAFALPLVSRQGHQLFRKLLNDSIRLTAKEFVVRTGECDPSTLDSALESLARQRPPAQPTAKLVVYLEPVPPPEQEVATRSKEASRRERRFCGLEPVDWLLYTLYVRPTIDHWRLYRDVLFRSIFRDFLNTKFSIDFRADSIDVHATGKNGTKRRYDMVPDAIEVFADLIQYFKLEEAEELGVTHRGKLEPMYERARFLREQRLEQERRADAEGGLPGSMDGVYEI